MPAGATVSELDELKRLLFGDEQRSLSELEERVENPRTRAQDVASVLSESVRLEAERSDELSSALRQPVNECIRLSVQQDTEVFADALFPIMGPAIRKSVMETFKVLTQRLNETLETAFSWQGLKWRVESLRTGVPVTELALRDTLAYRVEQVFLIHRETGLLIRHAARDDLPGNDSDAVSAMLTAIRDFVRDSFGGGASDLDTADIGEHTVWLLDGPAAILAVVFRGVPPLSLRERFRTLIEELHAAHAAAFEDFAGDTDAFAMLDDSLAAELEVQSLTGRPRTGAGERAGRVSPKLAVTLGVIALAILAWLVAGHLAERRLAHLVEQLRAEPGVVVTAAWRDGGEAVVEGLADPLARSPERIAVDAGYAPGEVVWRLAPIQSMDPPLVAARAERLLEPPPGVTLAYDGRTLTLAGPAPDDFLARVRAAPLGLLGIDDVDTNGLGSLAALAAARLDAPDSVKLSWADGVLTARGSAGVDWLERAASEAPTIERVDRFDASAVAIDPDSLLARWRRMLSPPAGVSLGLEGGVLVLSGTAPRAWIEQVRRAVPPPVYVDGLDTGALVAEERVALVALAEALDGRTFRFAEGSQLREDDRAVLEAVVADVARLRSLATDEPAAALTITAVGYTDPSGSPATNERLRAARGEALAAALNDALDAPGAVGSRAASAAENDARERHERAAALSVELGFDD